MERNHIEFEVKMYTVIKVIIWGCIYWTIYKLIDWRIEEKFGYIMREGNVARSLRNHHSIIIWCIGIVGLLSIVWWLLAWGPGVIRSFYEQNTFIIAIFFNVVCWTAIIMSGFKNEVIIDDLRKTYQQYYTLTISSSFTFNMYAFPPDTVKDVIFVGKKTGRTIVFLIMILCILSIFLGEM